ncbi:heparin lyase I family protein [Nocardia huaxiensis]|uniref:Heparin lyase I family protein n=1 Tax=Nocardia huaxiensis TaxID=2755382 RepID=A0A7D6V6Z6_9NOCA|nr:polysaccharide lyase [Nocardia huaxiensis]QLY27713.1 heparin lyase I family protein [Nocardia huaxiensis]
MSTTTTIGALFASLLVACSPGPPPSPRTFVGDYETGNFNQWAYCQNIVVTSGPCADYTNADSMSIVTDIVRQGHYAARFEVDQGDTPGRLCCGDRAEVSGEDATQADEGDERWYQWSTRFDTVFPAGTGWSVVSQWHANEDGSPPLAIAAGPTNVSENHWGVVISTWNGPGDPGPTYTPWSREITRDVWNDIKLHVKWSARDSDGYLELWVDGRRQTFDAAPCTGEIRCAVRTLMPDGGGVYFKQGYYRDPGIPGEGIVYHDGFSQSATEAGLEPLS